jgi:ribosomal protein L11 methyltransferase
MNYIELHFTLNNAEDYQKDLLINTLGEVGFDTFEETENGFKAYIQADGFNIEPVKEALEEYREMFDFNFEQNVIAGKNWNEEWESNFEPLEIAGQVYVRATFHQPREEFKYEIVIDPKMAFGTGHHQTTSMMMELMLYAEWRNKNVLDMGCGTGILAILASKLGAEQLTAIDYDVLCYDSTIENTALNGVANVTSMLGGKEVIPNDQYDIILANINRNILTDQMARYAEVLKQGGEIYFSGFYAGEDLDIITAEARKNGLEYVKHLEKDRWVAAKFVK